MGPFSLPSPLFYFNFNSFFPYLLHNTLPYPFLLALYGILVKMSLLWTSLLLQGKVTFAYSYMPKCKWLSR